MMTEPEAKATIDGTLVVLNNAVERMGAVSKGSKLTLSQKVLAQRVQNELRAVRDQYRLNYYEHIDRLTGENDPLDGFDTDEPSNPMIKNVINQMIEDGQDNHLYSVTLPNMSLRNIRDLENSLASGMGSSFCYTVRREN